MSKVIAVEKNTLLQKLKECLREIKFSTEDFPQHYKSKLLKPELIMAGLIESVEAETIGMVTIEDFSSSDDDEEDKKIRNLEELYMESDSEDFPKPGKRKNPFIIDEAEEASCSSSDEEEGAKPDIQVLYRSEKRQIKRKRY